MGIALKHAAVHEGAGVAFVRVADDVFLLAGGFCDRAPLQPGGIAGAATAAQAALYHFLHHFGGRHLGKHAHQGAVSGSAHVFLNTLGIDQAGIFQHDFLLPLEERHIRAANQAADRRTFESVEDLDSIGGGNVLVESPRAGRDQRSFGAQPHASDTLGLAFLFPAPADDFLVDGFLDAQALAGNAARCDTHIDMVRNLPLGHAFVFGDLLKFFRSHGGPIS